MRTRIYQSIPRLDTGEDTPIDRMDSVCPKENFIVPKRLVVFVLRWTVIEYDY